MYEEAKISCSIFVHTDVYDMLSEMLMSRKYRPEPSKLALHCGNDPEMVLELIDSIRRKGAGRHMSTTQLEKIKQEALRTCEEVRSSWTFK